MVLVSRRARPGHEAALEGGSVVTWLGIYPTVLLLFVTVAPWLADWPLPLRTAVLTVLVVLLMTWIVAPALTRWLRPWLQPRSAPT